MLAYELLVAPGAVRNLIRENQLHHLENTSHFEAENVFASFDRETLAHFLLWD